MRVNDEINNSFLRHERFERGLPPNQNRTLASGPDRNSEASNVAAAAASINRNTNIYSTVESAGTGRKVAEDKPLIDFGEDLSTATNRLTTARK